MQGTLSGNGAFHVKKRLSLGTPAKIGKENTLDDKSKAKLKTPEIIRKTSNEAILDRERKALSRKVHVRTLYSVIQRQTGSLGGGGAGGAIYGEITLNSFQGVVDCLCEKCEFSSESVFLDIGAGLGKPNFHVAINPGVKLSLGVELIGGRWWQSMLLLNTLLSHKTLGDYANKVFLGHSNVTDMRSFDPVTHVYSFNRGFPPMVMEEIARSFHRSKHSKYFICFDKERKLEEYGFNVTLVDTVKTSMSGSGEQHRCFIYRRNDLESLATPAESSELFATHTLPAAVPGPAGPLEEAHPKGSHRQSERAEDVQHSRTAGLLQSPAAKQAVLRAAPRPASRRVTRQQARLRRAESLPPPVQEESKENRDEPKEPEMDELSSELACWKTWAVHPSAGLIATWDLVAPPAAVEYAPHVEHSETYISGRHAMLKGKEVYHAWVDEQVGLHRSKRSTRRRASRHNTS